MERKPLLYLLLMFTCASCFLQDEEYDAYAEDYDTLSWDFQNYNALEVTTVNGDIAISPTSRKTLDAIFYRRCWGTSPEDAKAHLSDISLTEASLGSTFILNADIPDEERNYTASFQIAAPDTLLVDLFIINGYLLAERVTSDLKFRVQNGSIETKLITGDLDLELITGGINIQDHIGNIDAVTSTGQVFCSMYDIDSQQNIDIQTGIGGVTLEIPSDASFTFEISTTLGKMYITGFNDIAYDRNEFYFRSGEVNGGDADIRIRCNSGSINLKAVKTE
jgi:hypothetical protein